MAAGERVWTGESAAELRRYIQKIEAPDFIAATWPTKEELMRPGGVMQMPYPTYAPIVDELWHFLFSHGFSRHPYELLPEDPPDAKAGMETHYILRNKADFESASVGQLSRYFMLCRRAERFSDGHIDEEFASGRILWALRRLQTLMESQAGKGDAV